MKTAILKTCSHGSAGRCETCATLKKYPNRAATYAEFSQRRTDRAKIVSENRSRFARKLERLDVPVLFDPPLVRVAYDGLGYVGVIDPLGEFDAAWTVKLEPARREFPQHWYVTEYKVSVALYAAKRITSVGTRTYSVVGSVTGSDLDDVLKRAQVVAMRDMINGYPVKSAVVTGWA